MFPCTVQIQFRQNLYNLILGIVLEEYEIGIVSWKQESAHSDRRFGSQNILIKYKMHDPSAHIHFKCFAALICESYHLS